MGSNLGYLLKSFLCNFLLKRVIWHLVLENGTKFKIPSEIKSPLAWNHQPSYNNDPLHRCCLGTSWRWSSMALWNEVLFTKDPKAISSQQPLLSRILAKHQTFHVIYQFIKSSAISRMLRISALLVALSWILNLGFQDWWAEKILRQQVTWQAWCLARILVFYS